MNPSRLWLVCLLALLLGVLSPAIASTEHQAPPTVITMTAPEYLSSLYRNTIIPAFEADNPDVRVEFVFTDPPLRVDPLMYAFLFSENDEGYFHHLETYVTSADVVHFDSYALNPYVTATGFLLDLTPLINADSDTHSQDFYGVAWEAFQWDGGMWALSFALDIRVLAYNRIAFDAMGVNYPDETWQLVDFINAAEILQSLDSQGRVRLSPLEFLSLTDLIPHLSLYTETTTPNQPDFSNPMLINAVELWTDYFNRFEFITGAISSIDEIPMQLNSPLVFANNPNWGFTLPPGGRALADVEGFAISRGTTNPEASYRLVKFLTENNEVISNSFRAYPARRDLLNAINPDEVLLFTWNIEDLEPDVQVFLNQAIENAIPPNERRFSTISSLVRAEFERNDRDIAIANSMQLIEQRAIEALAEAQTYQSRQIVVEAPTLQTALAPGEIVLNFGLNIGRSYAGVREQWQDIVNEFSRTHPVVGDVNISDYIYGTESIDDSLDCFFDTFTRLNSDYAPEQFLVLDPLVNADPDFDPGDFWTGILEQARVQGRLYGYPLTIQPMIMRINVNKFNEAGLPIPQGEWTTSEFAAAVQTFLSMRTDSELPIITNNTYGISSLLMLIASYGGLPIDHSSDPIIYSMTGLQALRAMEQLIGYVHDGVINYDSPIYPSRTSFVFPRSEDQYITIDFMGRYRVPFGDDSMLRVVTFPVGDYIPVAYDIGMVYINRSSQNVEACYDWIRAISDQVNLFDGMPARISQLDNPALVDAHGDDAISFYYAFGQSLNAPNVARLPSSQGGEDDSSLGGFLKPNFFYYALDNVILHNADLTTEMEQAEENLAIFQDCTSRVEQLSVEELQAQFMNNPQNVVRYYRQFVDCAVAIIPELREAYSFFYQDDD